MTALEMITRALRLANVVDEIDTPSAEQGEQGLDALNDLMGQWDRDGIKLGWEVVADLSDTIPLDLQDQRAVRFNLAIELAGEYGIDPLPRVQLIAKQTYDSLAKAHQPVVACSLDQLPRPAGYGSRSGGSIETG
jgi:hypothetical protein